ncbi:MAG: CDC48 family AAA ATPase, partial [Candidatus Hodarchaeota archaeon]
MSSKNDDKIVLRVAESKFRDVGRSMARLDPRSMEKLGLSTGEVVEIVGRKRTAAIAWPSYPEDAGLGLVRIDGILRSNANVGIGDPVEIRKINAKPASQVTIAPTEPLRLIGGETYLQRLLEGRPVMKGDKIRLDVVGRSIELVVSNISPPVDAVIVVHNTRIVLSEKPIVSEIPHVSYEDIGGLKKEIQRIREMVELPLRHPEVFQKLGIEAPKGVLLYGPPGTGKTLLAKAVASETNAHFISISGPEIMSKFYGESEANIREIFKEAEQHSPSIIFIDEIDAIAPKREEVTGEVERRVVSQLLALMDGLETRGQVVVIGATNRPNAVDPALRRPGRFDREIEIGIPDRNGRFEILQIHTRGMPLTEDVELEKLSAVTHGYVGADIAALAKEAAMHALRRVLPEINIEEETLSPEILDKLVVTDEDFSAAYKEITPTAMREVFIEVPMVKWDDIGGLEEVKQELREAVEWPLKYPEVFKQMGAKPPKGILLFGPPGTGKTLLAKAVASESESNFISIKGPEVLSKWVGESEKAVREIFRKAKSASPSVIFMDELDAITPHRGSGIGDSRVTERVISQILTELDGIIELNNVIVIGASNRPDIIDRALLRPGRFDKLIYVPLPDRAARIAIFKIHTRNYPLADDVDLEFFTDQTEEYSGAEIEAICNEASMTAIREFIYRHGDEGKEHLKALKVRREHFEKAMKKVPKTTKKGVESYERFIDEFRQQPVTVGRAVPDI